MATVVVVKGSIGLNGFTKKKTVGSCPLLPAQYLMIGTGGNIYVHGIVPS
jgi:hypothetical protein